jgi:phosphoenolpyruvate carboxykinase (ATP)
MPDVIRNASPAKLIELALRYEPKSSELTSTGALACKSGSKTGRSPKDKRIVESPESAERIWWGPVNVKLSHHAFMVNRERAVDYLRERERVFVVDAFAGHDPDYRVKIRVICSRAYHALFMSNMLIPAKGEELKSFVPDFVIYNAGSFPANRYVEGMTSSCSIDLNFERAEMVILGSQYAGEMKKGVLTLMMYLMTLKGQLCLHSSANEDPATGDSTLFFGLSGTGKTTLSADPARILIGDDEHVWTDKGLFNVEGGCAPHPAQLRARRTPALTRCPPRTDPHPLPATRFLLPPIVSSHSGATPSAST